LPLPLGRIQLPSFRPPDFRLETVRRAARFGLIVAAAAFGLSLLLPYIGVFRRLELATQDQRLRLRGERPVHPGVALVEIDEASLAAYGNSWPLPRDQYALLLNDLKDRGARTVGMDLLFVGPDRYKPESPDQPTNDEILAFVIARDPRVVNGIYFPLSDPQGRAQPAAAGGASPDPDRERWWRFTEALPDRVPLMRSVNPTFDLEPVIADSTAAVGHVALYQDLDGVSRAVPLLINHRGRAFPALSLVMAANYLGTDWRRLRFEGRTAILPYPGGEVRIPVDAYGRVLINFPGDERVFKSRYSFHNVMREIADRAQAQGGVGGAPAKGDPLAGKAVLVCNTASTSAISDFGPTPFSTNFPLAYAHASVLNSILLNDFIRTVPRTTQAVFWLLTAALLGVFTSVMAPIPLALVAVGSVLAYMVAGWGLTSFAGATIELVPPVAMIGIISLGNLLRGYVMRDRQRRAQEQELAVARKIQQDLLPRGVLAVQDVEVAGTNLPCFAVGGDYFDYFTLADGRIALAIADVSGKGVPAALLMSNLQAILRAECARGSDVTQVPSQANKQLMESMPGSSKFVTFFYGALDPAARRLSYSNAGHNPPLVVRTDGAIQELEAGGLLLGVFPFAEYEQGTVDLGPGDVVVLFTDGVTEAESRRGLYGDERLHELLRRVHRDSAREIADAICKDVAHFSHGLHQSDDVTVVVVRVKPGAAPEGAAA
jgi:CHASE2 domain-containing sensor protein